MTKINTFNTTHILTKATKPPVLQSSYPLFRLKTYEQISFTSNKSEQKRAQEYVRQAKKYHGDLTLAHLNPDKLSGITDGIKVFEGLAVGDVLKGLHNAMFIPIVRGCRRACVHCLVDAKPPERETLSSMHWDDFTELMDGLSELSSRLGFNFIDKLQKDKTYYDDDVLLFMDSEPLDYKGVDSVGNIHNAADAYKYAYERTGANLALTTSGWNPKDKFSQKAAEDLVEYLKIKPKAIKTLSVSITPFNRFMVESIKARLEAIKLSNLDPVKNKNRISKLKQRSSFFEKLYIERMANTLKTFFPVNQKTYVSFIIQSLGEEFENHSDYNGIELFEKIKSATRNKLGIKSAEDKKNFELFFSTFNRDSIGINTSELRPIIDTGRNDPKISGFNQLYRDYSDSALKQAEKKSDSLYRVIDTNGEILFYEQSLLRKPLRSGIKLNFRNKEKITPRQNEFRQVNFKTKRPLNNRLIDCWIQLVSEGFPKVKKIAGRMILRR